MKIELNFAVKSILIRSLRFAGLILTGIAIFLPLYLIRLSHKEHADKNFPPITAYQPLRLLVFDWCSCGCMRNWQYLKGVVEAFIFLLMDKAELY